MSTRLELRIRADKTGPEPAPGVAWPMRGVEIVGDPPTEFEFPARWAKEQAARGWVTLEGLTRVERPSKPNPIDRRGSAGVAPAHRLAKGTLDDPKPHEFLHADYLVLDTLSHGVLRYKVVAQPDKYVNSDNPAEKVTLKHYAAGNTRVDNFYRAVLEG